MKDNKGVVYVAFGQLYLAMALFSLRTLKNTNHDIPVTIVTNLNIKLDRLHYWSNDIDTLHVIELSDKSNRDVKTSIFDYVSYAKIAYIDADTYILKDLTNAWKFLEYFDVLLKLNPTKQKASGKGDQLILDASVYVRDAPHFNSGVIFFKKSAGTADLFEHWSKRFLAGDTPYDQVSLVDSIFVSNARILPLTQEWNFFPDWRYFSGKANSPYIVHYTNRISYALERELLDIANTMGLDAEEIKGGIRAKRKARKAKIGRLKWWQMLCYWWFHQKQEKQRWHHSQ